MGPKWGQNGAKIGPRWCQNRVPENTEQRVPPIAPFWPPEGIPKWVQEPFKMGSNFGQLSEHVLGLLLEPFLGFILAPGLAQEAPKGAEKGQLDFHGAQKTIFKKVIVA